jgi:hypothetical protein
MIRDWFPTRWDRHVPRVCRLPWLLLKWLLVPLGLYLLVGLVQWRAGWIGVWVWLVAPFLARFTQRFLARVTASPPHTD